MGVALAELRQAVQEMLKEPSAEGGPLDGGATALRRRARRRRR